jgi:hypothetical protein
MSAVISGVSTISNIGISPELPHDWFKAWYTSWAVAFPSVVIIAPIARRLVGRLTKPPA